MILIGCTAVPAVHLYYIQEMIAALIIFSVLFVGVWLVVFFLFLLDWAVNQMITWMELHIGPQRHGEACLGSHRRLMISQRKN